MSLFSECEQATFKPENGPVRAIEVIFNAVHQDLDIGGKPIGAPSPRMWVVTKNLCPKYGDIVELHGVKYIIREVQEDGLELTELIISKSVEQ